MSNEKDGVKVAIRIRQLISRELKANETIKWKVHEQSIWETDRNESAYTFDKILEGHATNEEAYEELAKDLVISAMEGINATIFAYGQTSSGKTYTMMGSKEDPGVIPRSIKEIFGYCSVHDEERSFLLRVSYMEIYNEDVTDLLNPEKKEKLRVRENIKGEVYVKDLSEVLVTCEEDIYSYLDSGELLRHFAATNMNERSSRSHTIFRLVIESTEKGLEVEAGTENTARTVRVSQLNLVDLAGSERAKATGAEGVRLKEGGFINTSLLVLSKVIAKLSETGSLVPFRESKLTRILQSSLGGNAKTCVICTATPAAIEETHSTLRFAKSAKMMKNKPIINEIMNDKAIIVKYKKRIQLLERELEQKNQRESNDVKKDEEIYALKGQLVGSSQAPKNNTRRRETFFHGPQGLIDSPRNMFTKSRLEEVDSTEDLRKQLFQLPAMVSDRSGAREGSLESEIESLKSSLEYERTKNCKIKGDLRELEEGCMEMGDRLQEHIDQQQEHIESLQVKLDDQENQGNAQKTKLQEMESILIAVGEEREDLMNQLHDKERKLRLAEERNTLILQEAEEQRAELESVLRNPNSNMDDGIIASPSKKRRSTESPVNFDPQIIDNLKSDLASRTAEISRLETLLKQSVIEAEGRFEKLNLDLTLKVSEVSRLEALLGQSAVESAEKLALFNRAEAEFKFIYNEKLAELEHMKLDHTELVAEQTELVESLKSNLVSKDTEIERLAGLVTQSSSLSDLGQKGEGSNSTEVIDNMRNELTMKTIEVTRLESMLVESDRRCRELDSAKSDNVYAELMDNLEPDLKVPNCEEVANLEAMLQQAAAESEAKLNSLTSQHIAVADEFKLELDAKTAEISRLEALLQQSEADFEEKLAGLNSMKSEVNDTVTEVIDNLRTELLSKSEEVARLKTLMKQSEAEFEAQLNSFRSEADLAENQTKNQTLQTLKSDFENQAILIQTLKSDLESETSTIRKLEAIIEESTTELEEKRSEITALTSKYTELTETLRSELALKALRASEVTGLETALQELQTQLGADQSASQSNIEQMAVSLSEQQTSLTSLSQERDSVQKGLLELQTLLDEREASSQSSINELTATVTRLQSELTVLRDERDAALRKVEKLDELLDQGELQSVISSLTEERDTALAQVHDAQTKVTQVEELLQSRIDQMSAGNNDLQSKVDQMSTGNNDLQSKVDQMSACNSDLQSKVDEMSACNNDLQSRIDQMSAGNSDLQSKVDHMSAGNNDLQSRVDQMSTGNNDLQSKVDQMSTGNNDLQSKVDQMSTGNNDLQSKVDQMSACNSDLQSKVDEMSACNNDLQSRIDQMSAGNNDLQSKVDQMSAGNNDLQSKVDQMSAGNNDLQSRIDQISAGNSHLQSALELLAQEKDSAEKYVQELQKQLDEGQTNFDHLHSEPIESLKAYLLTKTADITRLEALLKKSTSELEDMRSEHAALKKEVSKYKETINSILDKEIDEFAMLEARALLEDEVSNLKTQLDTHVYSLKEVQLQLEVKSEEAVTLQKQLSTKDADLLKLESSYESKLTDLEMKHTELSRKLSEEIRAKNGLRADCDELMVSLQRKDRTSKNQEEEIQILDKLREEVASKDEDIALKVLEIQECLRHIEAMEQNRLGLESQIEQLKSQIEQLKVALSEEQSVNTSVTQERDVVLVRVGELQAQLDEGRTSSQSDLEHVAATLAEKQSALLSLAEERDSARKQIEELQGEVANSHTNTEQMAATLTEQQSALTSLTEQRNSALHQVQELQTQLCAGRDGLQATVVSLTEGRDAALQQLSTLQGEAEQFKRELNSKVAVMEAEILTLISAVKTSEEMCAKLTSEAERLKEQVAEVSSDRDDKVKIIEELNNQIVILGTKEEELLSRLSAQSSAEQLEALTMELSKLTQQLSLKSEELAKVQQKVSELQSANTSLSNREAVIEEEVEELRKSALEYEMMKTSHFQLKGQHAALVKEKQLSDAAKSEIEADYSKYQKYSVETISSEQEKLQTLLLKYENMEKDLSTEIVELKKDLGSKIATLTTERDHLSQQVNQYSAQLASARGQVSDAAKDQEALKALLQKEVERYDALEKQRAEVNKNYLEMTNKYQAASTEADAIESKYSELDTNFTTLKESLEKEIIRRKYVETVARVSPKTYNPKSLEDFMKSSETDHTDYLNRIKKTYVDVGLVCQICDKKRKVDPSYKGPVRPGTSKPHISPNNENKDPVINQNPDKGKEMVQKRPPSPSAVQPASQREKVTLKPQQKKNNTENDCPTQ